MLGRAVLVSGLAVVIAASAWAQEKLNPSGGGEIGTVVEAWLSPHQEPGEEKDTPKGIPDAFRSKAPSLLRAERKGIGHGRIRFTRDLSRAYVDVALENIKADDGVMFHIHCGPPDLLGPILVDFGHFDDVKANFADGVYSFEVTNKEIERTAASGHGVVGMLTAGCPTVPVNPALGKVKTVAGMEAIARRGELYFNLHTKGQVYFGDIRGQLMPVAPAAR
jgi:CHRD domain